MTDQSRRVKPASVAAFLFMPQFSLCFQHFSFIVPVFIRTIALVFEQAGILPPNHPAIRYGMEGVRKYKFSELMGEAWYTLRSTHANPYQWSLFAGVVMMIVFTILSVLTTLMHAAGMIVGTASAQIFDNDLGPTDMDSVTGPSSGMFDYSIPAVGTAQGDYAIMILDKMLRQGAKGVGGNLQNAFGSLMQVYNTGILVVAGIMLFWCVLSVVVDTAKTGQLGGGRHNMVWAPIRIVFALGLMIPLGTVGFSSGQFMIMKLAEWGSNFGTRGWVQYVNAVAGNKDIVSIADRQNASSLINSYVGMWVCRIAYNGFSYQAMPSPPAIQLVTAVDRGGQQNAGEKSFAFTNGIDGNLCGTVTYPTDNSPAIVQAASGRPTEQAMATYKQALRAAFAELFIVGGNPENGELANGAKELACGFVAQHIFKSPTSPEPEPLGTICGSSGGGLCGAGPAGSGEYPKVGCLKTMLQAFDTKIRTANETAFGSFKSFTEGPAFMADITDRGWAGMGVWYKRIEEMNTAAASVVRIPITIAGGTISTTSILSYDGVANAWNNFILGPDQEAKTNEILKKYSDWWETVPALDTIPDADPNAVAEDTSVIDPGDGKVSKWKLIKAALSGGDAVMTVLLTPIMKGFNPLLFMTLPTVNQLYPMALLAKLGNVLLLAAGGIYAGTTIVTIKLSLVPTVAIGSAVAASTLMQFALTLAGVIVMSGMVLSFLVPMLPFIRVAFSVLTWMTSVFEAVVLVPIAALAFLHTEGEGMAGSAKQVWGLWLNILTRPILTVAGFVGSILIFNTFTIFLVSAFFASIKANLEVSLMGLLSVVAYTVIFVGMIYTAANATFKLVDLLPSAVFKYLGGQQDHSFDSHSDSTGAILGAAGLGGIAQSLGRGSGQGQVSAHGGPKEEEAQKKADALYKAQMGFFSKGTDDKKS